MAGEAEQPADVTGLAVDPADARHLWASLATGVYESRDGGETWQPHGLDGQPVRWLALAMQEVQDETQAPDYALYAGIADGGLQRWAPDTASWQSAQAGLPAGSTLTVLAADPVTAGLLWAAMAGRLSQRGRRCDLDTGRDRRGRQPGAGVGDQPCRAGERVPRYGCRRRLGAKREHGAGRSGPRNIHQPGGHPHARRGSAATRSAGVDARIEVVWPHAWAPVESAQRANIGLRLFMPGSLALPRAAGGRG